MAARSRQIIIATCTAALLCTFALYACAPATTGSESQSTSASDRSSNEAASGTEAGSASGNSGGTDTCDNDPSASQGGDSVGSKYVDGVVLVTFATSTSVQEAQAALAAWGARPSSELHASDLASGTPVSVTLPDGMSVEQGVEAAKQLSCVAAAQPNYIYHLM